MATKVAVLEHFQEVTSQPSHYIKRRIAKSLIESGYARRVSRWLIQLIRVSYDRALRSIQNADGGQIKPPRRAEGLLLYYPIRDRTSYIHV